MSFAEKARMRNQRDRVEQATAAPGEVRRRPIKSDHWFTREIAESLGIAEDFDAGISEVVIVCRQGAPVRVTVSRLAARG